MYILRRPIQVEVGDGLKHPVQVDARVEAAVAVATKQAPDTFATGANGRTAGMVVIHVNAPQDGGVQDLATDRAHATLLGEHRHERLPVEPVLLLDLTPSS